MKIKLMLLNLMMFPMLLLSEQFTWTKSIKTEEASITHKNIPEYVQNRAYNYVYNKHPINIENLLVSNINTTSKAKLLSPYLPAPAHLSKFEGESNNAFNDRLENAKISNEKEIQAIQQQFREDSVTFSLSDGMSVEVYNQKVSEHNAMLIDMVKLRDNDIAKLEKYYKKRTQELEPLLSTYVKEAIELNYKNPRISYINYNVTDKELNLLVTSYDKKKFAESITISVSKLEAKEITDNIDDVVTSIDFSVTVSQKSAVKIKAVSISILYNKHKYEAKSAPKSSLIKFLLFSHTPDIHEIDLQKYMKKKLPINNTNIDKNVTSSRDVTSKEIS